MNIKFRFWDEQKERMIIRDPYILVDMKGYVYRFSKCDEEAGTAAQGDYYSLTCLKGQFLLYTGMKDSSDKDIYEGDVVKIAYWWSVSNFLGVIIYDHDKMTFALEWIGKAWDLYVSSSREMSDFFALSRLKLDDIYLRPTYLGVAGNIYENPELLKEECHE